MSPIAIWVLTLLQQALAILIGGVIAVGWGRQIAEGFREWREDRRAPWIAYIDVPRDGHSEAFYYIGPLPSSERPPTVSGQYNTYQKVPDEYFRWTFIPDRRLRSRKKLYLTLMTALQTQDNGHILQGHPLRPSNNSWQSRKPLGRFEPFGAAPRLPSAT